MDSIKLLSMKDNANYMILSEDIINRINDLFTQSNINFKRKKNNKKINILKNTHFQLNKNKFENKLIMILNKVSNDNIDKLVVEFLQNIEISSEDEFKTVQHIIFTKIIKEIDMLPDYYNFITSIFKVMYFKHKYEPTFLINILQNKVNYDYNDIELQDDLKFIEDFTSELYRVNNLKIIKYFIHMGLLSEELNDSICNILLNQNKYYIDISFWFTNMSLDNYKEALVTKIKECNSIREKFLLENLFDEKVIIEEDSVIESNTMGNNTTDNDELKNLMNSIIEEYLYFKSNNDIKDFIEEYCIKPEDKNLFCSLLIQNYFMIEDYNSILTLFNILIKNKGIFKSNISRGLVLYYNNNDINNMDKIKKLLLFLKSHNITKNIEFIFKKHKIKTFYKIND
jgi:hypothetical protein